MGKHGHLFVVVDFKGATPSTTNQKEKCSQGLGGGGVGGGVI